MLMRFVVVAATDQMLTLVELSEKNKTDRHLSSSHFSSRSTYRLMIVHRVIGTTGMPLRQAWEGD